MVCHSAEASAGPMYIYDHRADAHLRFSLLRFSVQCTVSSGPMSFFRGRAAAWVPQTSLKTHIPKHCTGTGFNFFLFRRLLPFSAALHSSASHIFAFLARCCTTIKPRVLDHVKLSCRAGPCRPYLGRWGRCRFHICFSSS